MAVYSCKGTIAHEMVFYSFNLIYVEDLRYKIFLVLVKNSPRIFCIFWRFLHILSKYSETSLCTANNPNCVVFVVYASILTAYSPNMAEYFPSILHRSLNPICVFSEYAERMENTQKEIFTFNNA
jgi:hypothetical protein